MATLLNFLNSGAISGYHCMELSCRSGLFPIFIEFCTSDERSKVAAAPLALAAVSGFITQQLVSQSLQSVCVLCTMGDHFENWSRSTSQITPTDRSELTQGCQTTPSNLAQSKERKDQILKHSGAIVQKPEGPNTYDL